VTFVVSVVVEDVAGVVEDVAGAVEDVAGVLEDVVGVLELEVPPQPARTVAAIAAVMTKAIVLFFITFPFF
jgi:hypothetical protein